MAHVIMGETLQRLRQALPPTIAVRSELRKRCQYHGPMEGQKHHAASAQLRHCRIIDPNLEIPSNHHARLHKPHFVSDFVYGDDALDTLDALDDAQHLCLNLHQCLYPAPSLRPKLGPWHRHIRQLQLRLPLRLPHAVRRCPRHPSLRSSKIHPVRPTRTMRGATILRRLQLSVLRSQTTRFGLHPASETLTATDVRVVPSPYLGHSLFTADVPLSVLFSASPALAEIALSEAAVIKAVRMRAPDAYDVRMVLASSSKPIGGGYELRRRDWQTVVTSFASFDRPYWQARMIYLVSTFCSA
jgi:hypothetical protein